MDRFFYTGTQRPFAPEVHNVHTLWTPYAVQLCWTAKPLRGGQTQARRQLRQKLPPFPVQPWLDWEANGVAPLSSPTEVGLRSRLTHTAVHPFPVQPWLDWKGVSRVGQAEF